MSDATQNPTAAFPRRDEAFDLAKGVGIAAVVILHLTSRSARLFHAPGEFAWWLLTALNQWVNYCVPLFLIVSAILMARSAARQARPDWTAFALRRLRSVGIPLVLWSAIYWFLRTVVSHDASLTHQTARTLPFIGRIEGPAVLLDWKARLSELIWGKAEFHLYFLSVLLQLCVLLPFLVILLRRTRLNIWTVTLIAILCQSVIVAIQKVVIFAYPGSCVLWYLYGLIPAVWIGLNWREWPGIRRAGWPLWSFLAVGGLLSFAFEADLALFTQTYKVSSAFYNGTVQNGAVEAYAMGASLLILSGLTLWRSGFEGIRAHLRSLGEMSLQIYLMHPILLEVFSRPRIVSILKQVPLPSLWLFLATFYGTYGLGLLLGRIPYLNLLLFARPNAPRKGPIVAPEKTATTE